MTLDAAALTLECDQAVPGAAASSVTATEPAEPRKAKAGNEKTGLVVVADRQAATLGARALTPLAHGGGANPAAPVPLRTVGEPTTPGDRAHEGTRTYTPWVQEQLDPDGDIVYAVHLPHGAFATHSITAVDRLLDAAGLDRDLVCWRTFDAHYQ